MLNTYQAGAEVSITFALPIANGSAIEPSSASYRVVDELDVEVQASTSFSVASGVSEVTIAIPAATNNLAGSDTRGYRSVEVTFIDGTSYIVSDAYLLAGRVQLVTMQNSFQTVGQIEMLASSIPGLDGWNIATQSDKIAAAETAYAGLCKMRYRFKEDLPASRFTRDSFLGDGYTYVDEIANASVEAFNAFPEKFKIALRRAQLIEADTLLGGDPIHTKRQEGIITETIGESKIFLMNRPPIDRPVSPAAMREIKRFVHTAVKLTRV